MQNQNSNVKIGNPAISISINWSKIAQNYSLRISNSKREVKLTIPKNGSYNQALEFAKSRENWIQSKLLNHVPEVILSYGSKILYQGQELIIQPSHNKNISISDKQIFISGPENLISGKIKGNLTLLGKTRPLLLNVKINKIDTYPFRIGLSKPMVMGVSGSAIFKRSDFGMNYAVKKNLVGDEIELIIEFEARQE